MAGGPGWRSARSLLMLLFWVGWLAMVGTIISGVVQYPHPVPPRLRWWQRAPFYRLQIALFLDSEPLEVGVINKVRDGMPYLHALGVGALILKCLFPRHLPAPGILMFNHTMNTSPQFQQLLAAGHKAGLRILLDLCDLDLQDLSNSSSKTDKGTKQLDSVPPALWFWLEQGVAGLSICDTDTAYGVDTLSILRDLMLNSSQVGNERILVVNKAWDAEIRHRGMIL